jgi:hypothetical protein
VPSGKLIGTLVGQTLEFDHADVSLDARTVATHLGDSFSFWNLRKGQELFNLRMDARGEGWVRFSANGNTLVLHQSKRPAMVLHVPSLSEIDAAETASMKSD